MTEEEITVIETPVVEDQPPEEEPKKKNIVDEFFDYLDGDEL